MTSFEEIIARREAAEPYFRKSRAEIDALFAAGEINEDQRFLWTIRQMDMDEVMQRMERGEFTYEQIAPIYGGDQASMDDFED